MTPKLFLSLEVQIHMCTPVYFHDIDLLKQYLKFKTEHTCNKIYKKKNSFQLCTYGA